MRGAFVISAMARLVLVGGAVMAEALSVKAVMSPREQIRADLPTGQPHFVLFVRREGKVTGTGILNGADLADYGMHDGKPRLLDNDVWRFVGGTGALATLRGAGIMHIRAVSTTDREFELVGEAVPRRR